MHGGFQIKLNSFFEGRDVSLFYHCLLKYINDHDPGVVWVGRDHRPPAPLASAEGPRLRRLPTRPRSAAGGGSPDCSGPTQAIASC